MSSVFGSLLSFRVTDGYSALETGSVAAGWGSDKPVFRGFSCASAEMEIIDKSRVILRRIIVIFYVNDIFGQKIYFDEKLKEIVDTLYNALEVIDDNQEAATTEEFWRRSSLKRAYGVYELSSSGKGALSKYAGRL